jgi:hypothetical protein
MDAKILCDINIGTAKLRHDPHKWQVGHVLHGREKKSGAVGWEHGWKIGLRMN